MSTPRSPWITTTEAAQRLGVKRATLYAYVSRGLLRSERRPGQQESLFDRAQVEAMASATRPVGTPQSVLRFRTVATGVSSQVEGELRYRGVPLDDVVDLGSVERAAALVTGTTAPADVATAEPAPARMPPLTDACRAAAASLGNLPLERRVPLAVQLLAASDPFAGDTDPARVRAAVPGVVAGAVALAAGRAVPDARPVGPLAELTLGALGGGPDPDASRLVGVLLVCLLDHGLTASTVAARVAASTRAGLHDCLGAAHAAMAGPLHGAAPVAAHALVGASEASGATGPSGSSANAAEGVARALRAHGSVPGFGHFLYPDGDPRAAVVLEHVARLPRSERVLERVDALAAVVAERTGALPNVDLASAAALHVLGLPAAAGEVLFQVARSFGVAAHVVEEYGEEPLRWRGRDPGT